ncbi:hypothetical protein FOA43_003501 [Brettanomyces nanus]|uniref:CNH domain-containing protein n=1 Tax=Eeniella nana TaxID=13502 RepID=A0A875S734_EENNA|nr:uncharacterized protein FOA43_003501 [Brettanomyces nanus]QPG76115.1 hypothetical protein FOA43_003501 [Brettanomyces nanus]
MIEAAIPASSFKISELSDNPSLRITASSLSSNNQLFLGLSDGKLLLFQLPTKQDVVNEKSQESGTGTLDFSKIEEEEPTLINSLQLENPVTQIEYLEYLNYLVLLSNKTVQIYSINSKHQLKLVDSFQEFNFNLIKTWSDTDSNAILANSSFSGIDMGGDINEEDSEYDNQDEDSISLATVKFQNRPKTGTEKKFIETHSNCHYLCMVSKRNLVVLRWGLKDFETKLEFKLSDKICLLQFLNYETLLIALESGDFVKMNINTGITNPIQFQFLSGNGNLSSISKSSFFFGATNNSITEAFKTVNDKQLVVLKDGNLIKMNNSLEPITFHRSCHSIDFKNPMPVSQYSTAAARSGSQNKLKAVKYWFPYIVVVYGNSIEIHNLEDFSLVQRLGVWNPKKLGNVLRVEINSKNMLLITTNGVFKFLRTNYNYQLSQFEEIKDFNNAICLLEKLNPIILDEGVEDNIIQTVEHSHSARQLKFMKLRKFQLLKAQELLETGKFDQAMRLFIEFIASPSYVLQHLPERIKEFLKEKNFELLLAEATNDINGTKDVKPEISTMTSDAQSVTRRQISGLHIKRKDEKMLNELITYLTDSRRKLTRLLDPDQPKFQWHGYTISLSLYEELQTDSDLSATDNLRLIDDHLLVCYIITNPRMIGPFFRIPNYCSFEAVEDKCLKLKLHSELIDFYYVRGAHEKALQLLERLCFENQGIDNLDDRNSSLSLIFNAEYMVRYLQKLTNKNLALILKYSRKLIELDSGYFKMIFMNNSSESVGLDRLNVLSYAQRHNWTDVRIPYLEYAIFGLDDHDERLVNALLGFYFDQDLSRIYNSVYKLYKLGNYNTGKTLKRLNDLEKSSLDDKQKKLILRLKIDPLRRLARHEDALHIFLDDLNDNRGAVTYCLDVRDENPEKGVSLIYKLLTIYLDGGDTASILSFLNDVRLSFLDPASITERLPDTIPLKIITPFLEMNLRNINSDMKSTTLESELLKSRMINSKYNKLRLQNEHFTLTAHSTCPVCQKTFGATSILNLLPDGTVIHYGCSRNMK